MGSRVAEAHVAERCGHRRDGPGVVDEVELVHVGHARQSGQHAGQGPPPDHGDERDAPYRRGQDEQRPVLQHRRRDVAEHLSEPFEGGDPAEHGGDALGVGGDGLEDQRAQPREEQKRCHPEHAEDRARDERRGEGRRCAPAAALQDARQPADVGTVDHRHEAAHARDEEGDDPAGDGGRDDDAKPVAVREQTHRHGPQQRDARRERDGDGDDGDGRTECSHHSGVREFGGLKGPSTSKRVRLARCHLPILPVAHRGAAHSCDGAHGASPLIYIGILCNLGACLRHPRPRPRSPRSSYPWSPGSTDWRHSACGCDSPSRRPGCCRPSTIKARPGSPTSPRSTTVPSRP